MIRLLAWLGLACSTACSYLPFEEGEGSMLDVLSQDKDQKEAQVETSPQQVSQKRISPSVTLDKKLAKIQAKLNEMHRENRQYAERIRVLEQAVTLGVVPERLEKRLDMGEPMMAAQSSNESVSSGNDSASASAAKADEGLDGLKMIVKGRQLFEQSEYGKALIVFEKVAQSPSQGSGEHLFWLGRSWFELSDLEKAMEYLREYLAYPHTVKHRQEAIYHLARAELQFGIPEKGIARLESLVREKPEGSIADAARLILTSYEQAL